MGHRFFYFPSIFLAILMAALFLYFFDRLVYKKIFAIVFVGLFLTIEINNVYVLTSLFSRINKFYDAIKIQEEIIQKDDDEYRKFCNLAIVHDMYVIDRVYHNDMEGVQKHFALANELKQKYCIKYGATLFKLQ